MFGHTRLTDTVDGKNLPAAASGGMAVTPKGVYDYVQSAIGGIGGGIVFKGTIGNAPAYDSTATYAVGDYCTYSTKLYKCTTAITTAEPWTAAHWTEIGRTVSSLPTPADGYEAGWEYVVVAPGTYAGKNCEVDDRIMSINNSSGSGSSVVNADWTVSQANISGAVTAESDLDNNTVVLGNGSRTVKKLANGTSGQWLRIENGVPTWVNHPNTDHGICVCEMEEMETETVSANNIKEIYPCTPINDNDIGKFQLVRGAIIFVKFDEDLVGDRTEEGVVYTSYLNVDNTGNVRIKVRESFIGGSYIGRGCIEEGDSACFIYDGEYWRFISIDAALSSVAYSGSYNDLLNKPILRYTDTNSASTVNRVIASGVLLTNQIVILSITYTYGITAANPTMKFTGSNAYPIYWRGAAYNGGASGVSHINPGDTVMYMFDGTNFNIISIDRKIDSVPTSGSINLITSAGVYTAIQDAIDAAALWWEELPAVSQS
ncbi:MAG: hypothetical protein J5510_02560 [Prevotella sp.]|nr:hypothetical protein [Prevotella sp.]